jgi:riboflavin kinase/FMN adenylyltransferase
MKVFRGLPTPASRAPCALAIGNFDGVHRGHQALLNQLKLAASERNIDAAVMTFEPHPREFFAQQKEDATFAPARIANLRDKLQSLALAGVDRVIVEHFNVAFAAMTPETFVQKVLLDGLHVRWVLVGEDFCYGAKRAGNLATLIDAGKLAGFEVVTLPTVFHAGERISSSSIRAALKVGDFERAAALMGHSYRISGHVIHGQKLGRTLGFRTMNLALPDRPPALSGIFVVQVHGLATHPLPGVASLGVRPTVDNSGRVLLETHLFDYDQDCYGR